jgi:hypothetical protein
MEEVQGFACNPVGGTSVREAYLPVVLHAVLNKSNKLKAPYIRPVVQESPAKVRMTYTQLLGGCV